VPFGQFFNDDITHYGIGLALTFRAPTASSRSLRCRRLRLQWRPPPRRMV